MKNTYDKEDKMINKKTIILGLWIMAWLFWGSQIIHAELKVKDVVIKQRWPWNGLVDITYSIDCDETDDEGTPFDVYLTFTGHDGDRGNKIEMKTLTGQGAESPVKAGGPYTVTWNMAQDLPKFTSSAFKVEVYAVVGFAPYMVVNLETCKARYTSQPPNLDDNTCRTTEMWLRKIPAGTFTMGCDSSEIGYNPYRDFEKHVVTLSQMFYIGIFECTQGQWQLVMGRNPSSYKRDTYPVENVSYDDIRGKGSYPPLEYPIYDEGTIDLDSFMGQLYARTGLIFDLPTESQWEYACRADTTTALNSGKNLTNANGQDSALDEVGRYLGNSGRHATIVGSYLPNDWGLYDMHGNVWEWCLDCWEENYLDLYYEDLYWDDMLSMDVVWNPVGFNGDFKRVSRGGGCNSSASYCRSASRDYLPQSAKSSQDGFRVVCLPPNTSLESQNTFMESMESSALVCLDARSSVGGRLLHGTEWISPVATSTNSNANIKLIVEGYENDQWTVANPMFNSLKKEDGWYSFELNEGEKKTTVNLLVLNDNDVVIHGGMLTENETWSAGKVHVVKHWVRVPEGKILNIEPNAIVKFCENAGIQVDGTLNADRVVFTTITDDTGGGDTDMNGKTETICYGLYNNIIGGGTKSLMNCDIRSAITLPADTTWVAGRVIHVMGTLSIPTGVTLTIEPGAIVKFSKGAALKAGGGRIIADSALFTHIGDD